MILAARLLLVVLATSVALALMHAPFATNDGPVHLAFARLIADHGDPSSPLQHAFYLVDLRPTPNMMSYFILVPLMKLMPPQGAEALLQWLCILAPVVAGWFAIRTLEPRNEYLAVALFPFSLNQMFFLGLYNYELSIAAFFLSLALYLRLEAAPTPRRAAALAAALLLAFFCHAAGFIMAVAGIAAMSGTRMATDLAHGQRVRAVLQDRRHVLFALLTPLPVCLLFLNATAGAPIEFGTTLASRVEQFGDLYLLAVSPGITRHVALGLRTGLVFAGFWSLSLLQARKAAAAPAWSEGCTAVAVAAAVSILVMFFMPDTMGGGWTHFRRMVVFPYFWMILLLACMPIPRLGALAALFLAAAASAASLRSAVVVQHEIERQMAPLAVVDRLVGPHCTIAPVVVEPRPVDDTGEPLDLTFNPYFHAASRLELKDDRVVLFNFLARLKVYPVRFRAGLEPQANLFGWKPYRHRIFTEQIDIDHYERESGMPVDYLLVWGKSADPIYARVQEQVAREAARDRLVYRSEDGWVSLYRRPTQQASACGR